MAKRSTPTTTPAKPTGLARPRAEVAEKLRAQINAGKEVQRRTIHTADDLDAYGAASTKWMEYNYDLLKVLFADDIIADEYRLSIPQFLITRDVRRNFQNAQTKNGRQITKLESILERLDLYAEPPPSAAQETVPAVEPIPHAALTPFAQRSMK